MHYILTEIHTILDLLRWTSSQFNQSQIFYGHGTDNFWDETLHLILPSLNLPINVPTEIYHAQLTKKEKLYIINLVNNRIKKRIPVPYLTNISWFCELKLYIDQRVFIPRSPIGELIKFDFYNLLPHIPNHILDMCTGSGCIAIAMAIMYPNSEIDAVDISIEALQVAEQNIQAYNLENRVFPIQSDLFKKLPTLQKYDLIITNPPYVSKEDICQLPDEFHHEPILSLYAKKKGLQIIHQILQNALQYLTPNGILICEVGISKNILMKNYPNIPFRWLEFVHGGDGVFLLTYKEILSLNI